MEELIFSAFNITVTIVSLFVSVFYISRIVEAPLVAGKIWFTGTAIIMGGFFIYHLFWSFIFVFLYFDAHILFQKVLLYETYLQSIGSVIITTGFAVHVTLALREMGFNFSLGGVIMAFLIFTVLWAGLLHVGFPGLDVVTRTTLMQNLAVGLHVSLGVLSSIVTAIYLIAYSRARIYEVKSLALGFAFISGAFVLYQLHWAIHTFYLGLQYPQPYQWLLERWWYFSALALSIIVGITMLTTQCTKTQGWKYLSAPVLTSSIVLIFGGTIAGLYYLK